MCKNCGRSGHGKPDCYKKGGDKEGQAPWQQKAEKGKETKTAIVGVDNNKNNMFAFTCSSNYTDIANNLEVSKSRLGTCMDSGASRDYCPNHSKFSNYRNIHREITMADGRTLTAIGMGDLHIELSNRPEKTKVTFKNAIHTPSMAFTLISGWIRPVIQSHSTKECVQSKIQMTKQLPPSPTVTGCTSQSKIAQKKWKWQIQHLEKCQSTKPTENSDTYPIWQSDMPYLRTS